jgi:branched-chain amino acid aminotransferase
MKYIFLNTEFVPEEQAFIHVSDLAIQRGYGIFDFFRIMDNHPLFLDDYLTRFYASASEMQLEVPFPQDRLREILFELIRLNNIPMSGIKVILTGGYSPDGYQIAKSNIVISQQPLTFSSDEHMHSGIKVITHEYFRDMPHVKTINYLAGIWLQKKVNEQKAGDVLYHHLGEVSEFPRCNFFIVRPDQTVITPGKNVLYGITRNHVVKLASALFKVEEGTIRLEDIPKASEAFLTSTTKRIIPITQVDNHVIGTGKSGPVTKALFDALVQLEHNERTMHGGK